MNTKDIFEQLACPQCKTELQKDWENLTCKQCGSVYSIRNGIPVLFPLLDYSKNFTMNYIEHYEIDAEIFDYFAERNCKATEHDERRLREYILSLVPPNIETVLDVGSGGSWVAGKLCKTGIKVYSFDVSIQNAEQSKKRIPSTNHLSLVGDGHYPPFKSESFDCIIASEVLEHIVVPEHFINSLMQVLKPGGTFIISTPYREMIQNSLCIHCNRPTPRNAHLHSFDEKTLNSLYDNSDIEKKFWKIFGNKALTILRTYIFLKYLPLSLWKIIDRLANFLINKSAHIIFVWKKKSK